MTVRENLARRLMGGGVWALSGRVVSALAGLAVSALLARLLTPEAFGTFLFAVSLVTVMAIAVPLGLNQTFVRVISESVSQGMPGRARATLRIGAAITVVGWLVITALLVSGGGEALTERLFDLQPLANLLGLIAIWVLTRATLMLIAEVFRGFHDIRSASIFGGALANVLLLVFCAGWWLSGHPLTLKAAFIATLLAEGVSTLFGVSSLLKWVRSLAGPGRMRTGEVLSISAPLWITNLTLFVLTQADLWIVAALLSADQIGIYGGAVRLVQLVVIPLSIVNLVLPPIIAEMNAKVQLPRLEKTLRATATVAGVPAFLALIAFLIFGEGILGLVYGDVFRSGGIILALLSVGQLVNVAAGSCGMVLMMTGHQRHMMLISIVCGIGMVSSAWWVAGEYGTLGVAVCAMTWLIIQNILMVLAVRFTLGIWSIVTLSPRTMFRYIKGEDRL